MTDAGIPASESLAVLDLVSIFCFLAKRSQLISCDPPDMKSIEFIATWDRFDLLHVLNGNAVGVYECFQLPSHNNYLFQELKMERQRASDLSMIKGRHILLRTFETARLEPLPIHKPKLLPAQTVLPAT